METKASSALNLWLAFWTQPRKVTKQLLASKTPKQGFWLTVIVGVIFAFIALCVFVPILAKMMGHINVSFTVFLGLFMVIFFVVGSCLKYALLLGVGRLLGGKANWRQTIIVMPWVLAINLTLAIPFMALYGFLMAELFMFRDPGSLVLLSIGLFILSLAALAFYIYDIILLSKCIGQLHRFSAWKGFLCILVCALVFMAMGSMSHLLHSHG